MGSEETDDDEAADTVTYRPSRRTITGRRDLEMDAIGWLMFLIMLVLVIPLLPIIALLALIGKLLGFGRPRAISWSRPLNGPDIRP